MPGGYFDLNSKKISDTYQRVVQYDSGSGNFLDGRGDPLIDFKISGSGIFTGNQVISGSLTVTGDVTINRLIVSQSIIELTGSTQWGDSLDDTHRFTGNVYVSGSIIRSNKTITNNYSVLPTDEIIMANTIAAFSASLYDAAGQDGNSLIFKILGNFSFTIQPQVGQTIDGNSNLVINQKYSAIEIIASGSNWYII